MKKNNIFKVVCVTILLLVLLTWILPTTILNSSELTVGERVQLGFFDLFNYVISAISNFGSIFLYILSIGGFYGVLYKTNGYRNLLDKIVQKYKGNEWIFLTLVMILFAVITSVTGLNIGLLFLFPFVITVILLMGYSKMTAAFVTIGSVCVGLMGSTYSAHDLFVLNQEVLNLPANSGIYYKIGILVLGLVLLIVNALLYAKKHKIDEPRKGFHYPETKNKNAKSWPIVLVMDLTLLIMILSFISWEEVFGITIFTDALTAIQDFKLFGFPIFTKLLGAVSAFGNWQITDLMILVIVVTMFVTLFCKVKISDMLHSFGEGAKRALSPAFVAVLVYVVLIILYDTPIALTIVKPIMDLTKDFSVVTTSVAGILSQFFTVEIFYGVYPGVPCSVLPYVISLYSNSIYSLIGIIWQSMSGFAMLFVPTSIVLVATLSYLKVSYFKWLKAIWKFLLELFAVLLIFFFLMILL